MRVKNSQYHNLRKKSYTNAEGSDSIDFENEDFIEGEVNIDRSIAAFSFVADVNTNMKDCSIKSQSLIWYN